jgi:hypothetical protein
MLSPVLHNDVMNDTSTTPQKEKRIKAKSGREISLTEPLQERILEHVANGKTAVDIATLESVDYSTLLRWKRLEIGEAWRISEMEYQLTLAEQFSQELMTMKTGRKDGAIMAIKQREAEFLRKQLTIAKKKYNDAPQVAIQVNFPTPIVSIEALEQQ